MTDFSITLKTQVVNCFGPSPSQLWDSFSWGVGTWGMKSAGTGGSPALAKSFIKVASAQTVSPTDALAMQFTRVLSGQTMGFSSGTMASEVLMDGGGYTYVFPGPVTEDQGRPIASYTAQSEPAATWATAAVSATTWS